MKTFDAVVIGSGPGGYVCAIRLAQLGKKTCIIEQAAIGGVCLNVGCIPSKALIHAAGFYHKIQHEASQLGIEIKEASVNLPKLQNWKTSVVKKLTQGVGQLLKANGVTVINGKAEFESAKRIKVTSSQGDEIIETQSTVIATGSRILEIPSLPFNGKNIIHSTDALELQKLPKKLIVVGGGFIGVEIGTVYAKLGSEVCIVEGMDRILPTTDPELVSVVEKRLRKLGVKVFKSAKALGVVEKNPKENSLIHLNIEKSDGSKESLEADVILVCVGRKPNSDGLGLEKLGVAMDPRGNILVNNQSKISIDGIYAIGDVVGAPQLAHKASMDGSLVAEVICGKPTFKDYKTIPWAIFCDPEIATVGLTEKEAIEKNYKVHVGKFPFAASGRALSTNDSDGFVKVVIEEKTEVILGVHIVGPEASNLIAEAALAIEMGACVDDLVRTIHTHPTLPEAIPEAFEAALSKAIHIYKPTERKR